MDVGAIRTDLAPNPLAEQPPSPREVAERRELVKAVKVINDAQVFGQESELTFSFDRTGRRAVLRIVNRETREVIRQIPNEQVLRLAESLTGE
jgi:flagellar protein FlaG